MMKKYVRYAMLGLAIFALALLAGCGSGATGKGTPDGSSSASVQSESTPQAASSSTSSAEKKAQKLTIKVYYPDEQGMKLIADKRTITLDQQEKYTAAMESLLEGTTEKGQTNIIPKQTKLRSVKVANGTATVDFTGDLRSIVDTLTEFPDVNKVQILIDGKKVESLGGHMDLSQPLTRMTDLLK